MFNFLTFLEIQHVFFLLFTDTLCRHVPEPLTSSPFTQTYKSIWYTDCAARRCPRWQSISTPNTDSSIWRPLLLFIPLRLGLSNLNPIYTKALKVNIIIYEIYMLKFIYN